MKQVRSRKRKYNYLLNTPFFFRTRKTDYTMKKTLMMVLTATLLGFGSIASAATDYSHYSDKELGALRGTMRKASVEDRIAYHQEWQKRLGELGPDQRQRFMKSPGGRGFNCDMNGMNGMGRMGRMQGMQGSQGFNCGMNGMQGSPGMNCGMNRMEESLGLNDSQSAKVKELREKTNAGMMDCKRALTEAGGDLAAAEDVLRKKGIASAGKRSSRVAKEGAIASYIHLQGKVGVLVEINCETDFVAKNDIFRDFVKDVTLHIAAAHPLYVSREQVPEKLILAEREIYAAQVQGKPANILEKIVDGKVEKFFSTVCLLEQPFIKNPDLTIKDLLTSKIAELGENMIIRRFTRYMVGEDLGE